MSTLRCEGTTGCFKLEWSVGIGATADRQTPILLINAQHTRRRDGYQPLRCICVLNAIWRGHKGSRTPAKLRVNLLWKPKLAQFIQNRREMDGQPNVVNSSVQQHSARTKGGVMTLAIVALSYTRCIRTNAMTSDAMADGMTDGWHQATSSSKS